MLLRLEGSKVTLVCVDGEGRPLAGAWVVVTLPEDPATYVAGGRLDADGRLELTGWGPDLIDVAVQGLGLLGTVRRVNLRDARDGELRLRYEADSSLAARFVQGTQPVFGVVAVLLPGQLPDASLERVSDPEGIAAFDGLTAGDYRLSVGGTLWWPREWTLTAARDPAIVELEVHARGDLLLRVTRQGLPLPEARLELECAGVDGDLADWIDAGLVVAEPEGAVTGLDGELLLRGLPAGSHAWRLGVEGLESLKGVVEVRAADEVLLPVLVE